MKIALIGNAGSGKSTLGFKLHKKLGFPLYHLDQYYWHPNWQRVDAVEFEKIHNELCDRDTWIIDGVATKLLRYRLEKADIIIFLDIPTRICLWRVIKRSLLNWGKIIPGNPEGCKQQLFSFKFLEFLRWIWSFNKRYGEYISPILDDVRGKKQLYVVMTQKEIDVVVDLLVRNCQK